MFKDTSAGLVFDDMTSDTENQNVYYIHNYINCFRNYFKYILHWYEVNNLRCVEEKRKEIALESKIMCNCLNGFLSIQKLNKGNVSFSQPNVSLTMVHWYPAHKISILSSIRCK